MRALFQAIGGGSNAQAPANSSGGGSSGLNDDEVIIIISVVVGSLLLLVVVSGIWYLWWEFKTSSFEEHELAAQNMSRVTTPSTAAIGASPNWSPGDDTSKTLVYTPGTVAASPSSHRSPGARPVADSTTDNLPQPDFWQAEAAARNGVPVNPGSFKLERGASASLAHSSSLYGKTLEEGELREEGQPDEQTAVQGQQHGDGPEGDTSIDTSTSKSSSAQPTGSDALAGSSKGSGSKPTSPRMLLGAAIGAAGIGAAAGGVKHVRVKSGTQDEDEIEMSLAPSPAAHSPAKQEAGGSSSKAAGNPQQQHPEIQPVGEEGIRTGGGMATVGAAVVGGVAAGVVGGRAAAAAASGSQYTSPTKPAGKTLVIPARRTRVVSATTGTNTIVSMSANHAEVAAGQGHELTTVAVASHVAGMYPGGGTSLRGPVSSTAGSVRSDWTTATMADAGTQTDGTIAMVLVTNPSPVSSPVSDMLPSTPIAAVAVTPGHITTLAGASPPRPSKPVREIRPFQSFGARWSSSSSQPRLAHAGASSPTLAEDAAAGLGGGSMRIPGVREFRHSASQGNVSAASSPGGNRVMRLVQQLETYPDHMMHVDTPGRDGSVSPSDSLYYTANTSAYSTPYATPPESRSSDTSASTSARFYNNALSSSAQRNVPAPPQGRTFVRGQASSRSLARSGSDASTASEHLRTQGSFTMATDKDVLVPGEAAGVTSRVHSLTRGDSLHKHPSLTDNLRHSNQSSGVSSRPVSLAGIMQGGGQQGVGQEEMEVASSDEDLMLPLPPAQAPPTPARLG